MASERLARATGMGLVALTSLVRAWNRLDVHRDAELPDEPSVLVANHGFGTLTDLNVLATMAALRSFADQRPVTTLVHQLAWRAGLGPALESLGCLPAGREAAVDALRRGTHVLVFPGGDKDAGKAWRDRNTVSFFGRHGFASVARAGGAPVVPLVTAGAGESLLVLSDGAGIARWLRLPETLRYHVAPVSVSVPWGLNVGVAGLLPYLPLPTKLETVVLPEMRHREGEDDADFAIRVQHSMQSAMHRLVSGRRPMLGRPRRPVRVEAMTYDTAGPVPDRNSLDRGGSR